MSNGDDPPDDNGEAPENPVILERVQTHGLEKTFGVAKPFRNTSWFERGAEVCRYVCVIRNGVAPLGSGFLVAPDLVLTAYHVVSDANGRTLPRSALRFVFDHALDAGDKPLPSVEVDIAADNWCPVFSVVGDLDFALVQISRDIGRGFLTLAREPIPLAERPGLAIIQHPKGEPRKIASDDDAIGTLSDRRILHKIPTEGGSSGSPVLTLEDWALVAVHQGWKDLDNKCVPIWLIAKYPGVETEISASLARRPNLPASPQINLAHASALLRDSRFGERVKGRELLRSVHKATPDVPIPEDLIALIVRQCVQGSPSEQRAAYETVHTLGLDARARDAADARWFEPSTTDDVVSAMAPLFAVDPDGLARICSILERAVTPVPPPLVRRVEQAFTSLRDHVHLATKGLDAARLLRIATRFRTSAELSQAVTSLYVDVTGGPPPPIRKPAAWFVGVAMGAVLAAAIIGFLLWWVFKGDDKTCQLASQMFDPFDAGFLPPTEWCSAFEGDQKVSCVEQGTGRVVHGHCRSRFPDGEWTGTERGGEMVWKASPSPGAWKGAAIHRTSRGESRLDVEHRGAARVSEVHKCDLSSFSKNYESNVVTVRIGQKSVEGAAPNGEPSGRWTSISPAASLTVEFDRAKDPDSSAIFGIQLAGVKNGIKECESALTLPDLAQFVEVAPEPARVLPPGEPVVATPTRPPPRPDPPPTESEWCSSNVKSVDVTTRLTTKPSSCHITLEQPGSVISGYSYAELLHVHKKCKRFCLVKGTP